MSDPSDCGTSATRSWPPDIGDDTGPLSVQLVSTQLTVMVPFGVTVQDCVAVPPSEVVAVTVKLFASRDWEAPGVQARLLPLRAAPVGEVVNAKLTVPPAGSVAVIT